MTKPFNLQFNLQLNLQLQLRYDDDFDYLKNTMVCRCIAFCIYKEVYSSARHGTHFAVAAWRQPGHLLTYFLLYLRMSGID